MLVMALVRGGEEGLLVSLKMSNTYLFKIVTV